LIEQGTPEEQGYSLWLNWAATLSLHPELLGNWDPPGAQAWVLTAFLQVADRRLKEKGAAGDAKLKAWSDRARAMRSFYISMTKGAVPFPNETPAQPPVSPLRQAVIGLALAQLGKTQPGINDKDENGRPARTGWRTIKMLFDAAVGGHYANQDLLRHPIAGKVLKEGTTTNEMEDTNDILPSWCGIFPTAIGKIAGVGSMPDWSPGAAGLPRTENPKPGDIVNKREHNHFGIITWVEPMPDHPNPNSYLGLKIKTVQGNAGSVGGEIIEETGRISDWNFGVHDLEGQPDKKDKK
jgi:hypothetical protein